MKKSISKEDNDENCPFPFCGGGQNSDKIDQLINQVGALTQLQREHAIWQKRFWTGNANLSKLGKAVDMMEDMFKRNEKEHTECFDRLRVVENDYVKGEELEKVKTEVTNIKGGFISKKDIAILAGVVGGVVVVIEFIIYVVKGMM